MMLIEHRTKRGLACWRDRELENFLAEDFWFLVRGEQNYAEKNKEEIRKCFGSSKICRIPKKVSMTVSWERLECLTADGESVNDLGLTAELELKVMNPVCFMEMWEDGCMDVPLASLTAAWRDTLRNSVQAQIEDCVYADLPKRVTMAALSQSLKGWMENDFCASLRAGIALSDSWVNRVQFHSQSQVEKEQREREDQQRDRTQQLEKAERMHQVEMLSLEAKAAELKRRLEEAKRPVETEMSSLFGDGELPSNASYEYRQAWKSRWAGLTALHQRNVLEKFLGSMRNSATDFDLKLSHEQGVRSLAIENGDVCTERMLRHGDSLDFDFTSPVDGWLTVLDLGSSGAVTVLLPNFIVKSYDSKLRIRKGQARHFLSDFMQMGDRQMTVQSEECLFGFEGVCVLITPEPLITELCEDDLTVYRRDGMVGLLDIIRQKLSQLDKGQWSVGLLEFITRPQNEIRV